MTHVRIKLIIAGVAVAIAVAFLAYAGVREGWIYYLHVDQFVEGDSYQNQRVRLQGKVGTEDCSVNAALLLAEFDLVGEEHRVRVKYSGVIPDLFKPGNDVVVEGRMDESEVFQADVLMTKCASKYETADGQAPHDDPRAAETGG